MFDRILIPTDGSDPDKPAVEMELDLAEAHDATLHVLYIVDQPTTVSGMGEGFSGLDDLLDALEERGQQATKAVVEQARESERSRRPPPSVVGILTTIFSATLKTKISISS